MDMFNTDEFRGGLRDDVSASQFSSMTDYLTSSLLDAYHRQLAATRSLIDYTVLSVGLLTLGLILVVEIARHKIDRQAHGRPFAKTVLEQVYRELSTLGIVEFAIFLGHTYAPNFNLKVEEVFAKVHFLLFFTAIINALMSVILSFVASQISYNLWVRTEELELNHYIAIREEFSRVEKLIKQYDGSGTDDATEYHVLTPKRAFTFVKQTLRYPILRRQYDKLLVQVRFHELRVHFLEANDLPLKFKVSDYLVKSELHVFKKCVHISTLAWIMVAAAVNLVYFLMGIVAYTSGSQKVVGQAMSWIFIGSCLAFVPISYAIFVKMQWIFAQIMKMKLIDHRKGYHHDGEEYVEDEEEDDDYDNYSASIDAASLDNDQSVGGRSRASYALNIYASGRSGASTRKRRKTAMSQLDLFWLNDPHLVIGAFQFMQLGYAIAASILLIFWDYIDVYYAAIGGKWFIVALVLCYLLFLWIMAQVVPRYTLCTSLGQLVNPRRLHETLAKCKLEEAKRKRRHLMEERKIMMAVEREAREKAEQECLSGPPTTGRLKKRASLEGASSSTKQQMYAASASRLSNHSLESEKMNELAKLVQTSNADLPNSGKSLADIRRERRKRRMRSVSDGVAFMRRMAETTGSSEAAMSILSQEDADKTKLPVPLTKSVSGRALESGLLPDPFDPSRSRSAEDATPDRRRRSRKKSLSTNVALMRSPASSLFDPSLSLVTEEKKEKEMIPIKAAPRRPSLDSGLPTLIEDIPSRSVNAKELRLPMENVTRDRRRLGSAANKSAVVETESSNGDASSDSSIIAKTVGEIGGGKSRDLADDAAIPRPGENNTGADGEDNANDDDTIDTAASDRSFDDVPDVAVSVNSAKQRQDEARSARRGFTLENIREVIQTQHYRLMSGVFGTMVAFFLVGMRVEIFLIEMGMITDGENTWHLNLTGSFWWEVAWLSSFVAVSIASTILFFRSCVDNDHLHLVVAGMFDLFLSGLCLSLLLGAEVRRCCAEGGDCCSQFGSRTYGGLGNIEPWTAIVAFRVFRYAIGRAVRRAFRRRASRLKDSDASTEIDYTKTRRDQIEEKADEYAYINTESKRAKKARANFEAETGNIVDLWNSAIGLYPDVVKKYGEFSGELLQAMLGIDVVEGAAPLTGSMAGNKQADDAVRTEQRASEDSIFAKAGPSRDGNNASTASSPAGDATSSSTAMALPTLDKKYCNLDPECQGIILAGQIGRPVRQRTRRSPRGSINADYSFLNSLRSQGPSESIRSLQVSTDSPGPSPERLSPGSGGGPVFVLDKQQDKEEHTDGDESMLLFADPNARLIRSMRRCERRLPPMLNEWAVVDVVITKYEIVYFDATDVDDLGPVPRATTAAAEVEAIELQHKRDTVRQALIATKGGKGLRLRDVAIGRKVVGHLELSEITTIKVERFTPLPHKEEDEGPPDVDLEGGYSMHQDEYWQKTKTPTAHRARQQRWKHAMEDRLKLASAQGDLYLRFFSDLEDWENNVSSQVATAGSDIVKNQALLWTQTIGRLCGTDQLQQKLPHLGDDGSAELLGYMEFLSRELDDADGPSTKTTLHRRIRSRVNLTQLGEKMGIDATQQQPPGVGGLAMDVNSVLKSAPSPAVSLKKRLRRKTSAVTFSLPKDGEKDGQDAAISDTKVDGDRN